MMVRLRFFDDYGSGWLWAGDDAAIAIFDVGPIDYDSLPALSSETRALAEALSDRHRESLEQEYPPGCQWPKPEREEFNRQVEALLQRMKAELGPDIELVDKRMVL